MSARKKTIAGHRVEIWETSFRIEGMSQVVHVGHHITEKAIEEMIQVIHEAVAEKAEKNGRKRVAEAVSKFIMEV